MNEVRWILGMLLVAPLNAGTMDVYFGTGSGEAKGIYHAQFDTATGRLGKPVLAAEIGSPGFLALDPTGAFLYAVARDGAPCVAAYRIGEKGALERLNTQPIGDGEGAHLSVHPSGKFLLTAQYGGGSVAVFPLRDDGSVGERAQLLEHVGGSGVYEDRQDAPHPHWTGFSPDGRFALVPDLGLDQIVIYAVKAEAGTLTAHGSAASVPGGGPRHLRFSPDGRFIYLLNELSLSVTTFAYDAATGHATARSTTPALSPEAKARQDFNSASEILAHPGGRYVYSANRGDDTITLYEADPATGALVATDVENIRGAFPRGIAMDPTGRWVLAAGQHSNTVSVFAIDPESGRLRYQIGQVVNVPACICIVFRERDQPAKPM